MTANIIISPVTPDGQVPVVDKGLLYSTSNTISTTTLTVNKNYYVDLALIVPSGATLTVPQTTILRIS